LALIQKWIVFFGRSGDVVRSPAPEDSAFPASVHPRHHPKSMETPIEIRICKAPPTTAIFSIPR
jgi:hypothetical protein